MTYIRENWSLMNIKIPEKNYVSDKNINELTPIKSNNMKTDKTCSLENLHGDKLKMELHPDIIVEDSIAEKIIVKQRYKLAEYTKPNIRQNGDGDDD